MEQSAADINGVVVSFSSCMFLMARSPASSLFWSAEWSYAIVRRNDRIKEEPARKNAAMLTMLFQM
jgi:hypothetical protein